MLSRKGSGQPLFRTRRYCGSECGYPQFSPYAKEAQIELLKLEVQNLRELTPMKLREYFLSVRTQLEEYNDKLRQELETINEEIKRKDSEISRLIAAHPGPFIGGPSPSHNLDYKVEALMRDLRGSKEQLEVEAKSIAQKLESLKHSQISINSSLAWDHD